MAPQTNSQKMAQTAYKRIVARQPTKEYKSFALEFPSLVHSCGLAQAVAFASGEKAHRKNYLEDLRAVLAAIGHAEAGSVPDFAQATRESLVPSYVRLSRNALVAAGWLKRYVEALAPA
ncbi:MAG: type III-B CRISPR module-associated protein Cmr5 [Bryobacteraceae bacterium]